LFALSLGKMVRAFGELTKHISNPWLRPKAGYDVSIQAVLEDVGPFS
jgi:hypothetical protein